MKRYRNIKLSTDPKELEDNEGELFTRDEAFDVDAEGVEQTAETEKLERELNNEL